MHFTTLRVTKSKPGNYCYKSCQRAQPRLCGAMMKKAVEVILLLFLLVSMPHAKGTRYSPPGKPTLTRCRSPEKETFTCWWEPGSDGGLPTTHALYYRKENSETVYECPDYRTAGENSCFFNKNNTSIWVNYNITVVATNTLGSTFSDPMDIDVMYIVKPNPPERLAVTVMEDKSWPFLRVSWEPPHKADTRSGWITLVYEIRVKLEQENKWEMHLAGQQKMFNIFSLRSGGSYLVQVRCKPDHGFWSEWSSTSYIEVPDYFPREKSVWILITVFSAFIFVILFWLLHMNSHSLKHCILPPVPGPKIKGFDKQLLKNGKSEEIFSALMVPDFPPTTSSNFEDLLVEYLEVYIPEGQELTLQESKDLHDGCLKSEGSTSDSDSGRGSCDSHTLLIDNEATHVRAHASFLTSEGLQRGTTPEGALCQKTAFAFHSTEVPDMPPCNFKPEEYKGMSKERMLEIRRQNCNPMTMRVTYYKKPVFIHQGHMQWLWDVDGRRYLDLFAGVATVSVGHCHPTVTAAAEQQLKRLWHTTNIYVYPPLHEYCEKLASYLPDPLKVIYLTNSGSEANDLAMLMARLHTGNFDIITFRGSYHGGSPQTMGLTSNAAYKYPIANGLGCTNTMCPDVFRGPWGGNHCRDSPVQTIRECSCAQGHCMANEQYIGQLKETLATSVPNQIAAFFGEPIQGVGGAVQYPKNFLKEAYKLVRERGGVCIADEVQTGFGRTGSHFWGFQGHDVIPDMVTMAKGIGNGFPMGAVVTTPEIAASFTKGVHFNTFGGNPVACAIASSVLDTIKEDGLQQNSLNVGTYLMKELAKLRDKYEIIGDVRGKGLQIGVEMVKDKASRDPLSPEAMNEIFEDVKDMGVLIGKGGLYGQTFRIKPPMCITMEDADFFLAVFNKSIHDYMAKR